MEGSTDIVASMTSEFTELQTTALGALGSVAGIAIVLFAGIYAWRYGKKVFNVISK